jgi:hypothetical protein
MKNKLTIATFVSRVFDPIFEIPVALLLAMWEAVEEGLRWRFLGFILFLDLIVPFIFFLMMLHHKQIDDWDVRKRSQRIPLYFFTMMCHFGGYWLAQAVGKTELASILLVFWVLGVVFAAVTTFWKISLHGGVNAVLIVFFNMVTGWHYWWLLAILPLVGWARILGKHHTWLQYWTGAILGGGVSYIALRMVGF